MSHLTIQCAADGVPFDGHDLINESALDIQCIDFHRGQFEPGNILNKTTIFQKFMDIGFDGFLAVGVGADSAADFQLYPGTTHTYFYSDRSVSEEFSRSVLLRT